MIEVRKKFHPVPRRGVWVGIEAYVDSGLIKSDRIDGKSRDRRNRNLAVAEGIYHKFDVRRSKLVIRLAAVCLKRNAIRLRHRNARMSKCGCSRRIKRIKIFRPIAHEQVQIARQTATVYGLCKLFDKHDARAPAVLAEERRAQNKAATHGYIKRTQKFLFCFFWRLPVLVELRHSAYANTVGFHVAKLNSFFFHLTRLRY